MIGFFVKHCEGEYIEADMLGVLDEPEPLSAEDAAKTGIDLSRPPAEIEKAVIRTVLEREGMNQSAAAKRLGINRSTLWRKLKQ